MPKLSAVPLRPLRPGGRSFDPWFLGLAVLAGVALATPALAGDGDPDPRFGQDGATLLASSHPDDRLRPTAVLTQPDGKLLMAGSRDRFNPSSPFDPHARGLVARVDADGRADPSFGSDPADPGLVVLPDLVPGTALQEVEAMRLLADGSILLAGSAQAFGPLTGFIVKLGAGGGVDRDFGDAGVVRIDGAWLHALAVDGRGRIVVAGEHRGEAGIARALVARYTGAGIADAGFGVSGRVLLGEDAPERAGYLRAVHVAAGDGLLVAGSRAEADHSSAAYWIHRLDAAGRPDGGFGENGSREFRLPGSQSAVNDIDQLVLEPSGRIVFAGHHEGEGGLGLLFGRLNADGDADPRFGDGVQPGFQRVDIVPEAWNRYPSGLVRHSDGRLTASAHYAGPARSRFVAVRLTAGGRLDADFGDAGVASLDLAPDGVFSDATALTLQAGQPVLAGAVMPSASSRAVALALTRLRNDGVFGDAFDEGIADAAASIRIGYDDLPEGFHGTRLADRGVTYRDVNTVDGVYPSGVPFTAAELGSLLIVEDATALFGDFPAFGSAPNLLTFGLAFVGGPNFTVGPLADVRLDLDRPAVAASVNIVHYENGPWGGVQVYLDAYAGDRLVASTHFAIADRPGRDNIAMRTLTIAGEAFDSLRVRSLLGGVPTAPRIMLDDLQLTHAR